MDRFVVDAGPFIHLDQINQIGLLKKFSKLFVPASVISEITKGAFIHTTKSITTWPNIKIVSGHIKPPAVPINNIAANLQRGELDCLYLTYQISPCIFLTDDLAARNVAEELSIEVHGSVGIIAYAFKRNWLSIEKAKESLKLLYTRSNLFVTYAIIENAIRTLQASL